MIEGHIIFKLLGDIEKELDAMEYPESNNVLDDCVDFDLEHIYYEPLAIADMFFDSDKTKPMPQCIAAFVKTVYNYELQDGNSAAACNLGALYYTGRIGEQSYRKAVELYTLAAELGDMQAAENLGYCYYYGRDVEKDFEKAFHYFALGAFCGNPVSLYKIGDMYKNGYFVRKNEKEAFAIYQKCLQDLGKKQMYICGADIYMRNADCFADGVGTAKDARAALAMYQKAEQLFYDRLKDGEFLIKGCYQKCIDRQVRLRAELSCEIPDFEWTKD